MKNNKELKSKILIGINTTIAVVFLIIAIILSTSNLFNGSKKIKQVAESSDMAQRAELAGNLEINVKNDKNEPVEGAYFDIYNKDDIQEIPNFELVAEGDYYFVEQDGKYIPNNINISPILQQSAM